MKRSQPLARCILVSCTWAISLLAAAETSLLVDDFESGATDRWWESGSGEYYKGGSERTGLSIVEDADRRSKVLHAHIRFGRPEDSDICFISRNFTTPNPIMAYERVSFWYKLTTAKLSATNALLCRLRVSNKSFMDLVVATPDTIRPGKWVRADLPVQPRRVVNIYGYLFMPIQQVTFRLDDEDETNVEFDFYVDDFRLHPKPQVAASYTPTVSPITKGRRPRVLVVRQAAAGYYNIEEALESMAEEPEITLSLFRGLHLPLSHFPATREELLTYDAVVMIDVDPYVITAAQLQWLIDFVASGGGLMFVAGPNTFGKAIDFKPGLAAMLPVTMPAKCEPMRFNSSVRMDAAHPVTQGIPETLGSVRAAYPLEVRPAARRLMKIDGETMPYWCAYSGGGRGDGVVIVGDGHESAHSAGLLTKGFYRDPRTGVPKFISVALIVGKSDGYTGSGAYRCRPSTTYRVSFWIKGDLPRVKVMGLAWKTDEAKPTARQNFETSIGTIRPTTDWRHYEGTFATEPDSKRLVVRFCFSQGARGFELGKRIFVDDVTLVDTSNGKPLPIQNGDAEEVVAPPVLAAGGFQAGRVLVLNAFPTSSDRGGRASLFRGPFYDDLIRDSMRWLSHREAMAAFGDVTLSATELDRGAAVSLTANVRSQSDGRTAVVLRADGRELSREELPAGGSTAADLRFTPSADMSCGDHDLSIEVVDAEGKLVVRRDAPVTLHAPVQAGVRIARWNTVEAGQPLRCSVTGTFRHTAKEYTGSATIAGHLIDPAGDEVATLGPTRAEVSKGKMEPADITLEPPNLASGTYTLEVELACVDGSEGSTVREEVFIVDPLPRENFYPIMGVSGHIGGDQRLDPRRQRERVDELWAHGFNTVTADTAEIVAHAAQKGMALFKDYTHLTLCGRDGHSRPCVYAPDHEEALRKRVAGYVDLGNAIPRGISLKFIDEPHCGPKAFESCEHCRREFERKSGYPMPDSKELAKLPIPKRIDVALHMASYIEKSYADVRRLCHEMGGRFDLIVTYCTPGFGGAALRTMEDVYTWSRPADLIDYDRYIYFYPTSQRVRYVMAHYANAMIRDVAQHLGKEWGHYTEIDDRNYPYQINPVEASSEHTYTAIAHGAHYINTFITRVFSTGCGARDERWADFGREACKIRSIGPLLKRLERPRSELALYFPYACYCTRIKRKHAPHYAHQLLTRAFGEADVAHELGVLEAGFGGRKAIVLCDTDVLPDRAAELLNEFVRSGGLLICDHAPRYNERGEACRLASALFEGGARSKLGELSAVTTTRVGKGRCLLLGHDLDTLYKDAVETPDPAGEKLLRDFVWSCLSQAGLKPFARPDDPDFEAGALAGEDTWLLVVINHAEEARTTRVTLDKLPFAPNYVVELPSYDPFSLAADQRSFEITLPSRYSKMIALYAAKPARVRLSTADTSRGKPLTYSVELAERDGTPCPGHHLVDITVRDAKGSVRTRYGGRWTTTAGKLEKTVSVPVNARKGAWTIECSVLGTEQQATARSMVN